MAGVRFERCGPGRPATGPERVLADKGYSSNAIRAYLRQVRYLSEDSRTPRPSAPTVPASARRAVVDPASTRSPTDAAHRRPLLPAPQEQFRAIATRYDETALSCQAMIDLATLTLWL